MTQPAATPTPQTNGSPPPEPAPDPAAVAAQAAAAKEGQAVAQLRAREVALVQKQQADARARQEFEAYRTKSQVEIDQARQFREKAKADPIAVLRELGWSEDAIAGRLVSGGKPTDIEERDALRRELTELRAWQTETVQRETSAKAQAAQQQALDAFHATAKAGADKWPLASKTKEARLKSRGLEIALEHARQGVTLTDEEVLDKLEEELSDYTGIAPRAATGTDTAASTTPSKEPSGQGTQPAPTLTNRAAATQATASKPDLLKMSDQERTEYVLSELKRMRASGQIVD